MASVDSGVETGNESNDSPAPLDRSLESNSLALTQPFVRDCSLIDVCHTFPDNMFERLITRDHILRNPNPRNPTNYLRFFPPSLPMIENKKDCSSSSNNNLLYSMEKSEKTLRRKYLLNESKIHDPDPGDLGSDRKKRSGTVSGDALTRQCCRRRFRREFSTFASACAPYPTKKRTDRRNPLQSLLMAAQLNDVDRVRDLLLAGLSPNLYDHQSRTPLHLAACKGYTDVVRLLLNYGAKPDLRDGVGNTALHLAVCTNHIEVVGLLLEAGTDVCSSDFNGRSPLQLAQSKLKILQRSQDIDNIKSQVIQVINMLMSFINKNKDSTAEDLDFLASFQDKFKISDSAEQVETGIKDLLAKLENLNVSTSSSSKS